MGGLSGALNTCPGCGVAGGDRVRSPEAARAGTLMAGGALWGLRTHLGCGVGKWGQGRGGIPRGQCSLESCAGGGAPHCHPQAACVLGGRSLDGLRVFVAWFPTAQSLSQPPPDGVVVLGGPWAGSRGAQPPAELLKEQNNLPFPAPVSGMVGWGGEHGVTGLLSSSCEHCRDSGGDAPASIHH